MSNDAWEYLKNKPFVQRVYERTGKKFMRIPRGTEADLLGGHIMCVQPAHKWTFTHQKFDEVTRRFYWPTVNASLHAVSGETERRLQSQHADTYVVGVGYPEIDEDGFEIYTEFRVVYVEQPCSKSESCGWH